MRALLYSTSCLMLLTGSALSIPALAETSPSTPQTTTQKTLSLNDARDGSLLFKTDRPGRYIKAPSVSTDVDMAIAGPIIRTTVSQTFENSSDQWVEGVYVFPLPENAAVDRLRIVVGGRLIEGHIKEKAEAKAIYQAAKREGKKASLVEQERPNIFTASVANIGPYESVAIQIEYQDKASIKNGKASMVFPMTVAPRFSPPPMTVQVADADGQPVTAVLDPVLDRKRISPPLMPPQDEPHNKPEDYLRLPVTLSVSLDAGFDIDTINSPYHAVNIHQLDADSATITLKDGAVPANRDFKLEWTAAPSSTPQKSVFKEVIGDDTFLMTMMAPPQINFVEQPQTHKRETVFVIDTSGSMGGTSIAQARKALKAGLQHLESDDTFNVIRFSNDYASLYTKPQIANEANINKALRWVSNLRAKGGTMMAPALKKALQGTAQEGRLKQVMFITDGAIGNEQQLFALIQDELKDARLFPIGIGSAPNRFFMSRAATFGRGTSVIISDLDTVADEMGTLFAALDNPVLTHLQLSLTDKAESYPARIPDLYDGEPVITITKLASTDVPDTLSISGHLADTIWTDSASLTDAEMAKGLSVLWARRKIQDLEEQRFDRSTATEIDKAILQTALDYHLVSRLTSLVAVDITPSRDLTLPLTTQAVPTQLPDGWDFAKLTGQSPNRAAQATPPQPSLAPPQPLDSPSQDVRMPGTASPHIFLMLLGSLLLGLARLLRRRRRVVI